jgi:hypothetical protein
MICNNFCLFINIYIWNINPYYVIVTFVGTYHMLSNKYITYLLIIIYDKDIEPSIFFLNGNIQGLSIRYEYTSPYWRSGHFHGLFSQTLLVTWLFTVYT